MEFNSNTMNSKSLTLFKKSILAFIRPFSNSTVLCHYPKCLELITRLRLGLGQPSFDKSKRNFQYTLNPICNCSNIETTVHCHLYCPNFTNIRLNSCHRLWRTDETMLTKNRSNMSEMLPLGDHSFNNIKYNSVLVATTECINSTKPFDTPLCSNWH